MTCIIGFGEAALLKTMKRRMVERLSYFTYVGDIVLVLNPYMGLPEHCIIKEYPNQVQYKLGENPNVCVCRLVSRAGESAADPPA